MFCYKCGTELKDESVFCYNCGTRIEKARPDLQQENKSEPINKVEESVCNPSDKVEAEVSSPSDKVETEVSSPSDKVEADVSMINGNYESDAGVSAVAVNKKSKAGIICFFAVAVVALCVAVFFLLRNGFGASSALEGSMVLVYDSTKDVTHVIYNDALLEDTIQGDVSYCYCESSMNGAVYALISNDDTLYLIDDKDVKSVAYDVLDFELSYSGSSLVYSDNEGNISLYDRASDKKEKIARECSLDDKSGYYLCISPDGKSVAFSEYYDGEYVMYAHSGGEKNRIARNLIPLSVSDGAEGYFACDKNYNLYYVDKDGEKEKLCSSYYGTCYLNAAGTEIIYTERVDEVMKYYYFIVGGEKTRINDSSSFPLVHVYYPRNTMYRSKSGNSIYVVPSGTLANGSVYLHESTNDGYNDSSNVLFVNDSGEKESIPCSASYSWFYNYGYYLNNGTLICYNKIYRNGSEEDVKIENMIDAVFVNNGQNVYYTRFEEITGTRNLYYSDINGRNEVKLYNDISRDDYSLQAYNDKYLLLNTGNNLYIFDNDGEKHLLTDEYAHVFNDVMSNQTRNNMYIRSMAYILKNKHDSKNSLFNISDTLEANNILDDISNPDFYSSYIYNLNNFTYYLSSEIRGFLYDANVEGYGLKTSNSCILAVEIDDEGEWNIRVSDVNAFYSSRSTSWTRESTGNEKMNASDYRSDGTALLAIYLAKQYPDLKSTCFEAYLYDGSCQALWFTYDTSEIDDVSSFSNGRNFCDEGWSDYVHWPTETRGISYEGYVIGTSPEIY